MSLTRVPRAEPALLDALRVDLTEARFTVPAVEELLGPLAAAALHREEPLPALRATATVTANDQPAENATLVRLFVLGAEVPRRAVEAAFPRLGADGARALGLVEAAGAQGDDAVRAVVDLRPYEAADAAGTVDWWLASDLGELATGRALHTDHVLGVGGASTTLAQVTVRDPRDRVLDLGTGCGIQALHASRHARRVVGTDISARALAFAEVPSDAAIRDEIRRTLEANGMRDGVHIRLTLSRGLKVTSGMDPRLNQSGPLLIVLAEWKAPVYSTAGLTLVTSSVRRSPPDCLDPRIHHNNLLPSILAKIEANAAGADDALMLDRDGFVAETNGTHVFVVRRGEVLTSHTDACPEGVTRQTVLDLCAAHGVPHRVARLSLVDAYRADEMFCSGTMGELAGIVRLDGRTIGDGAVGPVTERLSALYARETASAGERIVP